MRNDPLNTDTLWYNLRSRENLLKQKVFGLVHLIIDFVALDYNLFL